MEELKSFINNNFISPDGGEIKSQDLQKLKTELKHILQQIHSDLSNDSSTDRTNNFERFKQLFGLLISNGGILFNHNHDISEDNVSDNADNTTAADLQHLIGKINKLFKKPEQKSRSGGRKSKKRKRRKRRKKKTIKKSRRRKNKRKRLRKKTKRKLLV